MNRRNLLKIILDTLMLLTLVLMYNKRVLSLSFHEIGGLALIGVFFVHVLINGRWVVKVTSGLRSMKPATRIGWAVDALLLVSFVTIGVSGAMISKKVFSIQAGGAWKVIHYFCAALAVVLMGVHLGLHAGFAGKMYQKLLHLPNQAAKATALVLTVTLVAYGGYSLLTTSFGQWISGPFRTMEGGEGHAGMESGGYGPSGEAFAENAASQPEGMDFSAAEGERPQRGGMGEESGVDVLNVFNVIAQFLGEMFVFATLTALIAHAAKRKRRRGLGSAVALQEG